MADVGSNRCTVQFVRGDEYSAVLHLPPLAATMVEYMCKFYGVTRGEFWDPPPPHALDFGPGVAAAAFFRSLHKEMQAHGVTCASLTDATRIVRIPTNNEDGHYVVDLEQPAMVQYVYKWQVGEIDERKLGHAYPGGGVDGLGGTTKAERVVATYHYWLLQQLPDRPTTPNVK